MVLVPQVMRKHARFGKKKFHDITEIRKAFLTVLRVMGRGGTPL